MTVHLRRVWSTCLLFCLFQYDHAHVVKLSKRLVDGVTSQLDHVIRNGDDEQTYPGIVE